MAGPLSFFQILQMQNTLSLEKKIFCEAYLKSPPSCSLLWVSIYEKTSMPQKCGFHILHEEERSSMCQQELISRAEGGAELLPSQRGLKISNS